MSSSPINLDTPARYPRGLYRYAVFMTCWAFLVVFIGATVKSYEAGLSIPEGFILHWVDGWWRLPNYKWEYLHRMLVGVMGIGLLGLVIWIHSSETRAVVKRFAVMLVGVILAQAVLGWATVTYFAHWQTSIPHAALGQTFLALMACLTAMLSKDWIEGPAPRPQTDAIGL